MKKILVFNAGSSSIKFSLYEAGGGERLLYLGELSSIGSGEGMFSVRDGGGRSLVGKRTEVKDHAAAFRHVFSWITSHALVQPDIIGHRMVHGGPLHTAPALLTPELIHDIHRLVPYAPEHIPPSLRGVELAAERFPGVAQAVCFDTAFHRSMPEVARVYALPSEVRRKGVQRYGFHGLSYQYILGELVRIKEPSAERGRIILAHLGHGASMAALRDGKSVDTTMGFSPAGGLVMSTRTGDIDPGVLLFLIDEMGMSPGEVKEMVNRRSGLLGVSGSSDDMRDLLAAEFSDPAARLAVELFCYQAAKQVGALAAVLGGLDLLVFTGGIGEHSPDIRRRICSGLGFLGIALDEGCNGRNEAVISGCSASVRVMVMKTDEELMLARESLKLIESI
ncbi:MAG: acetate/propionate family kinase [Candidatus Chlorobium antarcticum]|jgi:acetate kinase|nr:acetate/propionate family kinase [Candidatus Chlorobium antarcticum]